MKKYKWVIAVVGVVLILAGIFLLPYAASGEKIIIRENYMKLKYKEVEIDPIAREKSYTTRMKLTKAKALQVDSHAEEGWLFLQVIQGGLVVNYNISDFSGEIALDEYAEDYAEVTVFDRKAKNITVCIKPAG